VDPLQAMLWDLPGISFGMSHRGRVVMLDAKGTADLATRRPVTGHDELSVRAITKTMTATLVMQQVEAGGCASMRDHHVSELDATAIRCPRHQHPSPPHPWRRRHPRRLESLGDDDFPDRDAVRREVRQQLTFAEPATTFRYSNIAYVLLGEALERSPAGRSMRCCNGMFSAGSA